MGQGNKVAASKDSNAINTLQPPQVRLPIGHSATDSSHPSATLFSLFVPTNTGGDLQFDSEHAAEMTLYSHDGTTILAGPTKVGSLARHLAPSTGDKPTHGTYYLLVKGSSPRTVSCKFRQTAIARDGTSDKSPPLIPWNFFSWPTAQKFTDGTTNPTIAVMESILRKYAKAYGHDGDQAVKFEALWHQVPVGGTWFGHCHMASRATVLFERPVESTVSVPGSATEKVTFTEEDLWFLAAEWFAGWADRFEVYVHRGSPLPFKEYKGVDDDGNETTIKNPLPDNWWSDFIKPAEAHLSTAELKKKVREGILLYKPSLAGDPKKLDKMVDQAALMTPTSLEIVFGQRAGFFYNALSEQMYVHKQALVGDLRGEGAANGADEVWNHAVFSYRASFKEILPVDANEKPDPSSMAHQDFMEIILDLFANKDYAELPSTRTSTNPQDKKAKPSAVVDPDGSLNTTSSTVENRRSLHVLHIVFDASTGNVKIPTQEESQKDNPVVLDRRFRWKTCRSGGDDIYIPRYLAKVLPAATTAPPAARTHAKDSRDIGNTRIELDLAAPPSPLLKIRKRYQR